MTYDNQTILFPLGMKMNANTKKTPFYYHSINHCNLIGATSKNISERNKAVRMTDLNENTHFVNCTIYLEGTITADSIIPFD